MCADAREGVSPHVRRCAQLYSAMCTCRSALGVVHWQQRPHLFGGGFLIKSFKCRNGRLSISPCHSLYDPPDRCKRLSRMAKQSRFACCFAWPHFSAVFVSFYSSINSLSIYLPSLGNFHYVMKFSEICKHFFPLGV